jgi:hypothetical protein
MMTKKTKEFVLSRFIYEVFKGEYKNPVLWFVIQSFPNHDKTIVEDNKFVTLTGHLEDLLADHKNDIEFVHDYLHAQVIDNTKNDRDQAMLNNHGRITLRRLQDEYHSIVPYVRPPSKKALKEKALEELLSSTQADSAPPKSVVKHPRLNHQALLLLDAFHQSYDDIGVSTFFEQILDFNIDDLEEAPSMQTVRNILADRHYTFYQLEQLINSTLDISEEDIAVTLTKLMRRDKFHESRFTSLSRKLTEYFDGERKKKELTAKEKREAAKIAKRPAVADTKPRRTRMIKKKAPPAPPLP